MKPLIPILTPMPPKPLSAEYFDGWYADQAATQVVAEIMNRHMGFPRDVRAGTVPAEAIPNWLKNSGSVPGARCLTSPAAAVPTAC